MSATSTSPPTPSPVTDHTNHTSNESLFKLSIGALGVVYGDIGTSPLYAVRECFLHQSAVQGVATTTQTMPVDFSNVMGILSLIFWTLFMVVVVKYLICVMRADNHGEGGILALLALLMPEGKNPRESVRRYVVTMLALFGAALLFADGMITPAISVLSAVEGLKVATESFNPFIIPITIAILIGLFTVQRYGTASIGRYFGPLMAIWFFTIAILGILWIIRFPSVLQALSPSYAWQFIRLDPQHAFFLLGSIVLCITGAEALYADMGHFGRAPIRRAWFILVFPALLLNYFGQGALLLFRSTAAAAPDAAPVSHALLQQALENPFFELAPHWFLYPTVVLATIATIIASQALISGAYSLSQQAIQLGYSPRLRVIHTSSNMAGQIYVPEVNSILMVACVFLVVMFQESGRLAAAYGIAVMGTMTITTLLLFAVTVRLWNWPWWKTIPLAALFLAIDIPFLVSNLQKAKSGGWFPLLVGLGIFALMTTWYRGRELLVRADATAPSLPIDLFLQDIHRIKPLRVEGTAVFMTEKAGRVPQMLLHHYKHNRIFHQRVVLLHVQTLLVPYVPASKRLIVHELQEGFWEVIAAYGFMQEPDVQQVLRSCNAHNLEIEPEQVSYYLGRTILVTSGRSRMLRWRKAIFSFLYHNERPATAFFNLPPNRVVELGRQVEL